METLEEFWEKRSRKFGNQIVGVLIKSVPEIINLHLHNWMLGQIEPTISRNGSLKVLDLGCGYGRLSGPLLKKSSKVSTYGIDISQTYVDLYNKSLNPRGKALVGNILKLPFKSSYFDIVFMVTTLMYVTDKKEQEKSITEIFRVLKSGGSFVIIERSPLGYSIFTLGGIVNKIRGKKHSEIPAVSIDPRFISGVIDKSGGQLNGCYGIPLFTLFFPIILFLSKINISLGKFSLNMTKLSDQKIRKFYFPSLYIAYIGKKHD